MISRNGESPSGLAPGRGPLSISLHDSAFAVAPSLARRAAMIAASFKASIRLFGLAMPRPAMSKAVPVVWRGAHERQSECDVHAAVEGEGLERDQGLVVIHGEDGIIAAPCLGMKQRVGRIRARDRDALGFQFREGWDDDVLLLTAERAGFACVRIEAGDRDARRWQWRSHASAPRRGCGRFRGWRLR